MADHNHTDHQHGSMDIRAQEQTFSGFITLVKWTLGITILVLVFLALARS